MKTLIIFIILTILSILIPFDTKQKVKNLNDIAKSYNSGWNDAYSLGWNGGSKNCRDFLNIKQ